ncbi:hypothetical protein [Nannocystis bainbridge]|nr:hypothetical protein [Nannocystis bainbridge]
MPIRGDALGAGNGQGENASTMAIATSSVRGGKTGAVSFLRAE